VLGVSSESVENVVLVLPKAPAERLVASADPQVRQAAVLEGEAFLNAAPISFWPRPQKEMAQEAAAETPAPAAPQAPPPPASPAPTVSEDLMKAIGFPHVAAKRVGEPLAQELPPPRASSAEAIKNLQNLFQSTLDRLVQELDAQAHFIQYAPPAFIPFHNGLYLELSLTTTLPPTSSGSEYRLAALAFDQHIAHLIRPVIAHFKDSSVDFDGIDFSTTVKLAPDAADTSPVAVEFIFPLKLLSAYADFDATGQQLIEASFILINGERVSLDLQVAEADRSPR
jgi:hypothetical protein